MTKYDIEIMSPVGSYEALMAAIQGGANAVYFGVGQLNMRAKSSNNFSIDDLIEITNICKENNVKTYLTVNTIIYNHEIEEMKKIVDAAKKHGITAIIASDMSVIGYASSIGMEIHISTQCNITNIEAVKFYAKYADVMVTARELSLKQVAEITKAIELEQIKGPNGELIKIEIFAHGALCIEVDNEYIMSPKDLKTIDFLDKILKAGVRVLKIEGRGRSPEYVKTVTQCYREAVDAFFDRTYTQENIDRWTEKLKTVYNRGFWDGYYLGRKMGEWTKIYGSQATKKKIYIGKITNYFANLKVAEVKIETHALQLGEEIHIIGPTTGVYEDVVSEIRVELKPVNEAAKGVSCSIPVNGIVRRQDKLYKIVNNTDDDF